MDKPGELAAFLALQAIEEACENAENYAVKDQWNAVWEQLFNIESSLEETKKRVKNFITGETSFE